MNTDMAGTMTTPETLTAMGSDARTASGKGAITLVAGGTSHAVPNGFDIAVIDVVVLNFEQAEALPGVRPVGLITLAALLALCTGFALRRRMHPGI